jgi:hypothetical protein
MVDFKQELRKRCRNPKCQMNLPEPVSNPREAFCVAGCYRAFYRSRCLICEEVFERKNEQQKVCGKRKCRSALRQLQQDGFALGRYFSLVLRQRPPRKPLILLTRKGIRGRPSSPFGVVLRR